METIGLLVAVVGLACLCLLSSPDEKEEKEVEIKRRRCVFF